MKIVKKVVYEVNGKIFDNRVDAIKEARKFNKAIISVVASKFIEVLMVIKDLSKVHINYNLVQPYLNITDEHLRPGWLADDKKYPEIFKMFLKTHNIPFTFFNGDEYKSAYIKIHINKNIKIDKIPTLEEVKSFINKA